MHIRYWPTGKDIIVKKHVGKQSKMECSSLVFRELTGVLLGPFTRGGTLISQLSAASIWPLITIVGGRCWCQKTCWSPYISKCQPHRVSLSRPELAAPTCLPYMVHRGRQQKWYLRVSRNKKISLLKCYALMWEQHLARKPRTQSLWLVCDLRNPGLPGLGEAYSSQTLSPKSHPKGHCSLLRTPGHRACRAYGKTD